MTRKLSLAQHAVIGTVAFMHGPQGSGKTTMIESTVQEEGRSVLYLDCRELQKKGSDSQLIAELARQTGYWPVFTLANSMGNLLDVASVGLIGQKGALGVDYPNYAFNTVSSWYQQISA